MTSTAAERGREVRQRLLQAAAELISERGWTAVTTRVLAERAGVAPGLVHYHFASLQALLTEAAIGTARVMVDGLAAMLEAAATPEEALSIMLGSLSASTGRDPLSLLFVETYLAATRDEELRRELAGLVAEFVDRFARWLGEHGVEAPRETAAVLGAAIDGLVLHRALDSAAGDVGVEAVLRRLLEGGDET